VKPGRLEAFSDGVLAIAITLLVLDLKLPDTADAPLGQQLAQQWPSYLAYLVSFAIIGIMWVNHHALFQRVARVDRALLFHNLALLFLIAALPFPTSVAAAGLERGGADARIGMFAYSVTNLLIGVAFSLIWRHIARTSGLLRSPVPDAARRRAIRRYSLGMFGYLLLCGLSFVSPIITLIGHGAVAVYYAFEQLPGEAEPAVPET
jgi:uncharacterized membrane protein